MQLSDDDADEIFAALERILAEVGLSEWHVAISEAVAEAGPKLLRDPSDYATPADVRVAAYLNLLFDMTSAMRGQDLRVALRERIGVKDFESLNLRYEQGPAGEFAPLRRIEVDVNVAPNYGEIAAQVEALIAALDFPSPRPGRILEL